MPLKVANVDPAKLELDPDNVRVHPEDNMQAIKASLEEFGQVTPIVVHKESNTVVGGNGTLQCIRELGWKKVAVVHYEGTKEQARALAVALNATGDKSHFDEKKLAAVVAELQDQEFNLSAMGLNSDELSRLVKKALGGPELDVEGEVEAADEEYAPPAHVRMVQLFLSDETIDSFMAYVEKLSEVHETDNLTDTVFAVMEKAANAEARA